MRAVCVQIMGKGEMAAEMLFDGQILDWPNVGSFRATTGLPKYQTPDKQCIADNGPIPEGKYKIFSQNKGWAKDDGTGMCNLSPAWGVQAIPRGAIAGACELYWSQWGHNRARLEAADKKTKAACSPSRGGFYIHDSTKGFSHGCIEVDTIFFAALASAVKHGERTFFINVAYVPNRETNGGTRV